MTLRRYALLWLFAASCIEPSTFTCPSGLLCPPGTTCDAARDRCVSAEQTAACNGVVDGGDCTVTGAPGRCDAGVCIPFTCGDGVKNVGEQCDGADLDGLTCESFGYYGVAGLACDSTCLFDRTGCAQYGVCGDGIKQGDEACDKASNGVIDDGGQNLTCIDFDFYAPDGLDCTKACTFDVADCNHKCGDGVLDPNTFEQCDGKLEMGQSCLLRGSDYGHVSCTGTCALNANFCRNFNWVNDISGTQAALIDVYAVGARDIVAVGAGGVIRHSRGADWVRDDSGTTFDLYRVWGSSSTDIFVVGDAGTILHYNGMTWSPMISGASGQLFGVWGSGPNDVWVAATGAMLHYNGSAWSSVSIATSGTFRMMFGTAANNIFAVGYSTGLWHYDGTAWTKDAAVADNPWLEDVWASSPSDVWLLGQSGRINHFDGTAWSTITAPSGVVLMSIWGSPSGSVYLLTLSNGVYLWTGTGWQPFATAPQGGYRIRGFADETMFVVGAGGNIARFSGTEQQPLDIASIPEALDIWGAAPPNMFAIGGNDIQHFDGLRWTTFAAGVGGNQGNLQSLWGFSPTDINTVEFSTFSFHYNGSVWTPLTVAGGARLLAFNNLWGSSSSNLFATALVTPINPGPPNGGVYIYNGTSWNLSLETGSLQALGAIWGFGSADVYAAGNNGRIFHFNGSWTQQPSGVTTTLRDIWGSSPTDVFAVGDTGTIVHNNGSGWSAMSSLTGTNLRVVSGFSSTDVYAGGDGGLILHYNGSAWSPVSSPTSGNITSLFRVGPVMFGATTAGRIFFDGTAWSAYGKPGGTINAMSAFDDNHEVAVGETGLLMLRNSGPLAPIASPVSTTWRGVKETGVDQFIAVGDNGRALTFNGTTFTTLTTSTTANLRAVYASALTAATIVGNGGTILHVTGTTVTTQTSGTTEDLYGIAGTSASSLYAVGDAGTILHFDGTSWTKMTTPGTANLRAIYVDAAGKAIAVGLGGTTWHFDGTTWTSVPSLTMSDLFAVAGRSTTDAIASGSDGFAAHWNGTSWGMIRTLNEVEDFNAVTVTPLFVDIAGSSALTRRYERTLPW